MTKRITRKDKAKDKALEERIFNRVLDHIGPILAQTFNEQNEYILTVMNKTIEEAHKLILSHSIEERKEALSDLENVELSGDGGEALAEDAGEYIKTKEEKEDDNADDS
tara:strand:+ start:447 stop:773 length:327 start_codon:yes stop_codon:yes gene_type:complete